MARVQITEPESYVHAVELPIMLAHINRGDHLGNEHLIAFLNEARVQYMAACGVPEYTDAGATLAKTAHLNYDANKQKLLLCPEGFRDKLLAGPEQSGGEKK